MDYLFEYTEICRFIVIMRTKGSNSKVRNSTLITYISCYMNNRRKVKNVDEISTRALGATLDISERIYYPNFFTNKKGWRLDVIGYELIFFTLADKILTHHSRYFIDLRGFKKN